MAIKRDTVSVTTGAANVTLTGSGNRVRVTNLDGAGVVHFRCDGTTAVADADECQAVAAAAGAWADLEVPTRDASQVVSIIASATTKCLVELVEK